MSKQLFAMMAVSVSCSSSSQNFEDGLCYALSQLGLSDLQLKNEQKQAIYVIYGGKDVNLFANWLQQKYLLSDTHLPLRPQVWLGWW